MINCRVHIKNGNAYMDNEVFVPCTLPALPRVGDSLHGIDTETLQKKASKNLEVAKRYAPQWFHGKSHGCRNPKRENLKDITFEAATVVSSVCFTCDSDIVDIEVSGTDSHAAFVEIIPVVQEKISAQIVPEKLSTHLVQEKISRPATKTEDVSADVWSQAGV
jgi:hypothetical protein